MYSASLPYVHFFFTLLLFFCAVLGIHVDAREQVHADSNNTVRPVYFIYVCV